MPQPYTAVATGDTPATLLYIIDCSGTMGRLMGRDQRTRMDYVRRALDLVLEVMAGRSATGNLISPRYRIGLITYSDLIRDQFQPQGGFRSIDDGIADDDHPFPIPEPGGLTHTREAFTLARRKLEDLLPHIQDNPAPVVCHLTDGKFDRGQDPTDEVRRLASKGTRDGNVLILNIFVGDDDDLTVDPIPSDLGEWPGLLDEKELKNEYARTLFRLSSVMPESFRTNVNREGEFNLQPGCRMLIPATTPDLLRLAFTISGMTDVVARDSSYTFDDETPEAAG